MDRYLSKKNAFIELFSVVLGGALSSVSLASALGICQCSVAINPVMSKSDPALQNDEVFKWLSLTWPKCMPFFYPSVFFL